MIHMEFGQRRVEALFPLSLDGVKYTHLNYLTKRATIEWVLHNRIGALTE